MIKEAQNKMQVAEKQKDIVTETAYYFPEYSITVYATSQEEALKKLQELINKDK